MRTHPSWLAVALLAVTAVAGCKKKDESPAKTGKSEEAVAAEKEEAKKKAAAYEAERVEAMKADAKAMTERFQAALKKRLLAAIEDGGAASAIEVCKLEAPKIAAQVPEQAGWTIGRTAPRLRNPANAPNEWQARGLAKLEERAGEEGVDIANLEWHEIGQGKEGMRFRYMRAIPTGGLCLSCHGDPESIDPAVKDKLAELYPKDEATGFAAGDLRGAFVVTIPLAN